jgi:predicted RNase H-like HicB family nuclease
MKKRAKKHYLKLVEWSAEDGCYVGRCPELFLGGVHGADEAKVYRELCKVVDDVVAMKTAHGDPLPEPLGDRKFSGKFVLRVDPAIHKQITSSTRRGPEPQCLLRRTAGDGDLMSQLAPTPALFLGSERRRRDVAFAIPFPRYLMQLDTSMPQSRLTPQANTLSPTN